MNNHNGKAMTAEEARRAMMTDPEKLRGSTPVDEVPQALCKLRYRTNFGELTSSMAKQSITLADSWMTYATASPSTSMTRCH